MVWINRQMEMIWDWECQNCLKRISLYIVTERYEIYFTNILKSKIPFPNIKLQISCLGRYGSPHLLMISVTRFTLQSWPNTKNTHHIRYLVQLLHEIFGPNIIYRNIQLLEVSGPSRPRLLGCGPSGRLWALRVCLIMSFTPFGRSGRVTHASVQ